MTANIQQHKSTHDAAKMLMWDVAKVTNDESLACTMVQALLPDNYQGNTREELPELFQSAQRKHTETKKPVLETYDPGDVGPVPKGYTDNGYYVFLHQRKRILTLLTPTQLMSQACLCDLADAEFWASVCPTIKNGVVTGFNHAIIGEMLMRKCREAGAFITSRVRGGGIWREGDKIIENLRGPVPLSADYTYIRFGDLPEFNATSAITGKEVKDWLDLFNWQDPGHAYLMLGWLASAPICGALKWRTHMFLTGPKNTGKSTLINGMADLLWPLAISVQGSSTEAGIRQSIGADSKACLLDEFESDHNQGRMRSVLRLVRSASSANSTIAKGTPEGKAMQFQLYSTFLLGAIIPIKGSNADQSRIVVIEMKPHGEHDNRKEAIEQGRRRIDESKTSWSHKMISLIDVILPSIDLFESRLMGESRHCANMAVLLGGAFAAINERIPTELEVDAIIETHWNLLQQLADAHDEDDSADCLNHLCAYQTRDFGAIGNSLAKVAHEKCSGKKPDINIETGNLDQVGIKVLADGFLIANKHPGLEAVFRDTLWAGGSWTAALKRLKGAKVGNDYRARFSGGFQSRGTLVPFSLFENCELAKEGKGF